MTFNRVHYGDCRESMLELAAAGVRVQCIVTSPPYWGLRSYLPANHPDKPKEIGLEKLHDCLGWATGDPCGACHVCRIVDVFRAAREVLADDGVLWLNYGDSYCTAPNGNHGYDTSTLTAKGNYQAKAPRPHQSFRRDRAAVGEKSHRPARGLKEKDMAGVPWRVAFALQADGWYLRSDVIWHKKNPMPESMTDRPTKAHEYLFLLAKSERYFYDADAIKEPASEDTHARYARARSDDHKYADGGPGQQTIMRSFEHMRGDGQIHKPVAGWANGAGDHSAVDHAREKGGRRGKLLEAERDVGGAYADGKGDRMGRGPGWRERKLAANGSGTKNNESFDAAMAIMPAMANKRTVWSIATEPYSEAHFATFPTALVEPCIAAGSRPGDVVLDPFGGSGTVAEVAERLGRKWLLCELNKDGYGPLIEKRTAQVGLELA